MTLQLILASEIDRIENRPVGFADQSRMLKINFVVSCDGNAEEILTRAKKIEK